MVNSNPQAQPSATLVRRRPGGAIASRPLHFIWLCDCSGSMTTAGKIQALNTAIKEAIPVLQQTAADNPNAQILVRAIRFADGAEWHIAHPTPVEEFRWLDLSARGITDMGKALLLAAEALQMPPMPERALPPVLVLITDGHPTDDFAGGLKALLATPWGQQAVRIGIAIGQDANLEILQTFIGNPQMRVMLANNPDQLAEQIRWASTVPIKSVSLPKVDPSQIPTSPGQRVLVQPPEQSVPGVEMW